MRIALNFAAAGFLAVVASAPSRVRSGTYNMKLSSTGPDSTLPSFFFMAGSEEGGSLWSGYGYTGGRGKPDAFEMPVQNCPESLHDNTSPDLRVPQLPWALQEDWGCERVPTDVPVTVLENDYLRASITPQWGGKVWSLYHKKLERELFFANPAHQPANIGYRKAWTSGGCEWNWAPGHIGHSVFTESPTYMATIDTERGAVVRVWEYDRQNHTVWSVDMFMEGDAFWVHPKIRNPTAAEIPGYWWTCVAMTATDFTRIVAPADLSVTPCTPWPQGFWNGQNTTFRGADIHDCAAGGGGRGTCAYQSDQSYIGNIPSSHDFFMHIDPSIHYSPHHPRLGGRIFACALASAEAGGHQVLPVGKRLLGVVSAGLPQRVRLRKCQLHEAVLRPLLPQVQARGAVHRAASWSRPDADAYISHLGEVKLRVDRVFQRLSRRRQQGSLAELQRRCEGSRRLDGERCRGPAVDFRRNRRVSRQRLDDGT
eukprot:Hpha_TRINITY_DN5820_c0_g1::TRINITY_DN5820_c0_g1_i1::g.45580::m.45580